MEQAEVELQHTLDQLVGLENRIQVEVDSQAEQGMAAVQELHMVVGEGIQVAAEDIHVGEGNLVDLEVGSQPDLRMDSPAVEGDSQAVEDILVDLGQDSQVVAVGSQVAAVGSQVAVVGSQAAEEGSRVVEGILVEEGNQLVGDNLVAEVDNPCWDHHSLLEVEAVPYLPRSRICMISK